MNAARPDPRPSPAVVVDRPSGPASAPAAERLRFTTDWVDLTTVGAPTPELTSAEHQARYARLESRARELALERRLAIRRTETDLTTGLGNRLRLVRTLSRRCEGGAGAAAGALLLLGVDRVQQVNAVYGHASGDSVLRMVARLVEAAVDGTDLPVRTAGDEFAVTLFGPDAARRAPLVAQRLDQALSRPVIVGGHSIELGVSIGYVTWSGDGGEVRHFMARADRALSEAKRRGRRSIVDHASLPRPGPSAVRRVAEALETGRGGSIEAWYRPVLDLPVRACRSVRLVPTWLQPDGEQSPLWQLLKSDAPDPHLHDMLGRAMAQALEATAPAFRSGRLSHLELDLRPGRFDRTWVIQALPGLLRRYDLPSGAIVLRVPEEQLVTDGEALREALRPLVDRGVWLCADDFGLGVASFPLLRRLGVRAVNLAAAVVHAVDRSEEARDIVRSIAWVAHRQGLRVSADGVARASQVDELARLGCDAVHGPVVPSEGPTLAGVLEGGVLVSNAAAGEALGAGAADAAAAAAQVPQNVR
jgi:diguanylate cyclase (GGDEF)-like protein